MNREMLKKFAEKGLVKTVWLDLDDEQKLLHSLDLIPVHVENLGTVKELTLWRSSGGIGYHIGITYEKPVSFMENIFIRAVLLDDRKRICTNLWECYMVMSNGKFPRDTQVDTIFDYKRGLLGFNKRKCLWSLKRQKNGMFRCESFRHSYWCKLLDLKESVCFLRMVVADEKTKRY